MTIVFMGTPDFAAAILDMLLEHHHDVIAVYTQPDKPKGRGKKLTPSPVKVIAEEENIPVHQPVSIRKESVEELRAMAPDLFVTAAFGQILSQELLDIPKYGCINVHASLLPRHRGSAPINWAVLQGDTTAGVTTMMTNRGIDTGDILMKTEVPLADDETAGELTTRLSYMGGLLLLDTLQALEDGTLTRTPQNEAEMTYDPMLDKSMGIIDWTKDAVTIRRQIHGLNPWPGASTVYQGARLKIHRARVADDASISGKPGEIVAADPRQGLIVACGSGALKILEMQMPGGKPMDPEDYMRGHPIAVGTILKEESVNE